MPKGGRVTCLAVRRHVKATIFWLPETSGWAHIHLTYRVETDPRGRKVRSNRRL